MQQHRHREGKETNSIIWAVPEKKACAQQTKLSSAGKLWEESDFKLLKMDKYCKDMWELLNGDEQQHRKKMFKNCQETWEKKKLGPSGDIMLHEKLKVKYVRLKLDENEGEHRIFTIHTVQFVRESQKKYYQIVAVMIEFDTTMSLDNSDEAHYDFWDFCPDAYDCFRAYYDLYDEKDNVLVYEKGGVCNSNFEEEEDME
jgi:hypothetical protein